VLLRDSGWLSRLRYELLLAGWVALAGQRWDEERAPFARSAAAQAAGSRHSTSRFALPLVRAAFRLSCDARIRRGVGIKRMYERRG